MSDSDVVRDAREAWQSAQDADSRNLDEMRLDLKFLAGEQWDEVLARQRVADGKPVFTINRLPQYVRQVTGDIRLNPPGIKVRAVDGGADPKTAETYTGLIRNIEAQSNATLAYVTGAENSAGCGVGYWRVTYDYRDEASFEMDLGIERIPSPFACAFDPGSIDPTGKDAEWCFVSDLIPTKEFEKRYPDATTSGFDSPSYEPWYEGDFVRVAEWWRKVPMKRKLMLLANGAVIDTTELSDEDIRLAVESAGGWVREREVNSHKVVMDLMNGSQLLAPQYEWPGMYLPVVRTIGGEVNVGDRVVRYGVVRYARDAQAIYNIQRTAFAESAAMAPKPKWLATFKQISAHMKFWRNANTANTPILPYDPDPSAGGPPQRIQPDMPAASALADAQLAAQDIEATIGIYREGLGKESNAVSGKAILSRQREGDVGTFVYSDNLAQSVAHTGRILVDLIPRVYDTERQVRIIGNDGREDFVTVNQTLPDGMKVNDLRTGRYDVVASVGPSYSTQREEARESMMAFFGAAPQAAQAAGDIFAETMDWPNADALKQRLRRMAIMQGVADPDPNDEDDAKLMQAMASKPQQPDPNLVLAQAEVMKAEAAKMKAQADTAVKTQELEVEKARLLLEAERLQLEQKKVAAAAMTDAADTESKIRERETNTKIASIEAIQSIVEKAISQHAGQMKQSPTVGLHLGEAADAAMADSMARTAANMDRIGQAVETMAQANQQMAESVAASNHQVVQAVSEMAAAQAAPRRVMRDPKTGRAIGVEIVRD